jgi:phage repressor protein C with HTH and peptisase S24 domain
MAPTIEEGEPVLIDRRQQSPRDADLIWAFAWGDIGAIKRLRPMPDGSVKILSDNPAVPPESCAWQRDPHLRPRRRGGEEALSERGSAITHI